MFKQSCLIVLASFVWASAAPAANMFTFNNHDGGDGGNGTIAIGTGFTVGDVDATVTALGVYDYNGTYGGLGLAGNNTLRLYDSGPTPILSLDITPSTTPDSIENSTSAGEFRFYNLDTPITLLAGNSYMIASDTGPAHEFYRGSLDGTTTSSPDFTGYFGSVNATAGLKPSTVENQWFLGPNLQYSLVPEPASISLLALVAIALIRRPTSRADAAASL